MPATLHNSWGEFHGALDLILPRASHSVCIFDADLAQLGLNQLNRIEQFEQLLTQNSAAKIRIALRNMDCLHRDHPRLVRLLESYGHMLQVQKIADSLNNLRDTLVLVDTEFALVRFDQDHPRSKLIVASSDETAPYRRRFDEIWHEGGTPFSTTPLGL